MINIAEQFTRFPAGRYRSDGPYSGERFREDFLIPAMNDSSQVTVLLDGTLGYGSSFLEEAFGGLLRKPEFAGADLASKIRLDSRDASLVSEIQDYLSADYH